MKIKTTLAALAAFSMTALPTMAVAAPTAASKLSVRKAPTSVVRSGAAAKDANGIGGGSSLITIIAVIAVAVGIALAADGGSKSP